MFLDDDQRHSAINTIDALQNLLYLIRLDASTPERVLAYVSQSDALLSRMQVQMQMQSENGDPHRVPIQ
jgi:hypothetical protein